MTKLQIIRDCMQKLTYSEMMTIAEWFANTDINTDDLQNASYWAHLLNQWACTAEFAEDDEE